MRHNNEKILLEEYLNNLRNMYNELKQILQNDCIFSTYSRTYLAFINFRNRLFYKTYIELKIFLYFDKYFEEICDLD